MTATLASPPKPSNRHVATAASGAILGGVSWDDYVRFRDDPANDDVRLTFDEISGRLEIGMPSGKKHESIADFLLTLVMEYGRVRRRSVVPVGSTTWRLRGAGGVEGDKAFHIDRQGDLGLNDNIPKLDAGSPPPDLVIEVDVTSPGVRKLPIYERIGVPEVWVWDDETIAVHRLIDGRYEVIDQSVVLPNFPLTYAAELVQARESQPPFELQEAFERHLRNAG
ncbi:MAG: Uma2 family endonuclease [Planctomycetota bacterium]